VHASFEEEGKSQTRIIELLRTALEDKEAALAKQTSFAE
jgi:hypothetical protein